MPWAVKLGGISAIFISNDGSPVLYFAPPPPPIGLNPAENDSFPVLYTKYIPGKIGALTLPIYSFGVPVRYL